MTTMESWRFCPLSPVPKAERIKNKGLGICRGGCNQIGKIWHSKYQLCATCANRYRYFGETCDSCQKVSDEENQESMHLMGDKLLCNNCHKVWRRKCKGWSWERFLEYRQAWVERPETFQDTHLNKIPHAQRVNVREVHDCQGCGENRRITNSTYQLCSTCVSHEQYRGKQCWCCGTVGATGKAITFDLEESVMLCGACVMKKRKYKTTARVVKHHIMTITECQICGTGVEHRNGGVSNPKMACIDHDHETGKIRGVLCSPCNTAEGWLKKLSCPETWIKRLAAYLANPPLDKPGIQ